MHAALPTLAVLYLAKKAAALLLIKVYGVPRFYRKVQKGVRRVVWNTQQRRKVHSGVRKVFRLPEKLLARWHKKPSTAPGLQATAHDASRPPQGPASIPSVTSGAVVPPGHTNSSSSSDGRLSSSGLQQLLANRLMQRSQAVRDRMRSAVQVQGKAALTRYPAALAAMRYNAQYGASSALQCSASPSTLAQRWGMWAAGMSVQAVQLAQGVHRGAGGGALHCCTGPELPAGAGAAAAAGPMAVAVRQLRSSWGMSLA